MYCHFYFADLCNHCSAPFLLAKMNIQPLELNQKFLTLVRLCAPDDNTSFRELLLHTAVGLYVFVTHWSDLISSSFFLIQYKRRDMEDVLGSMLQTAAVSCNIFGMASTFMLSKRLRGVFSLFQTIYNECNWSIYKHTHTHICISCLLSADNQHDSICVSVIFCIPNQAHMISPMKY